MSDAKRRRIRTRVQTFVSTCAVLMGVIPLVMAQLETVLPAQYYAYAAGAAAVIVQGASFVTRVMNLPAVDAFLEKHVPWLAIGQTPVEDPVAEAPVEDGELVDEVVEVDPADELPSDATQEMPAIDAEA